jgi:serine/threonine protein kinase
MSAEAQDLVRKLLNSDPDNRISINDVVNHQFLNQKIKIPEAPQKE